MNKKIESRPTFIYTLSDPRTGEVRYVGKTVFELNKRLSLHKSDSKREGAKCYRICWIHSLLSQDLEPIIELIETVPPDGDWVEREKYWIRWYRDNGYDLTNATDGGDGVCGYVQSGKQVEKRKQAVMIPLAQYTQEGKFIDKWESSATASKALGLSKSNICNCAANKTGTAGKSQWRYWSETLGADIEPYVNLSPKKPVARYTLDWVFIDKWESATEAGRVLGIDQSTITKCLKEKGNTAGGFRWKYS